MKRKKKKTKKRKKQDARLENHLFDEPNRDIFEKPDRDIYEETVHSQREFILGDDWLMDYCLFMTARAALEEGEAACRELLDHCNGELEEGLKIDCGDNPKAMLEELLRLTDP